MTTRLKMARSLETPIASAPTPDGYALGSLVEADHEALGEVLYLAYLGGPDQEENDAAEGRAEIARTTTGHYGPLVHEASFVARGANEVVGASLVVLHDGAVLLAHAVVHPTAMGRGLGAALVTRSLVALAAAGHRRVLLAVHVESRARALYKRLGFVVVPRDAR